MMIHHRLFLLAVSLFLLTTAVFAQTGSVEGIAVLPNHGGPAVGATVTLFRMGQDSLVAVTDTGGHFAFDAVAVGPWGAQAVLAGYEPAFAPVFVLDGQTAHVMLMLRGIPTGVGRVEGVVLLPNHGGPAVGATVVLFRARGDSLVAMSDDSGRFAFDSARVGEHDIYAALAGYLTAHGHVFVMDGLTAHVMLVLRSIPTGVGRVEGVVLLPNHGGPAVGATVVLFRARGDSLTTVSDDSGRFAFDSARVGEHDIYAALTGYLTAHGRVFVRDGQTARVMLVLRTPPTGFGRVEGAVLLPEHGGPAVGATVVLFRARGDSLVTMSDDSGRFAFDSARVGEHDIYATLTGYLPAHGEVHVRDGQTAHVILILHSAPTGGGTVSGTVLLADSTPAPGAFVWLAGRGRHGMYHTGTDSLGHFLMEHVRAGQYFIMAGVPHVGFASAEITVADSQVTEVTLVLSDSTHRGRNPFDSPESADESSAEVPVTHFMAHNYPNPFNPITTIEYSIPTAGDVKLAVYDLMGRETAVLVNGYRNAGTYSAMWNGSDVPSGVYFYRLTAGSLSSVSRMILMK
jgi:hypothetical protein